MNGRVLHRGSLVGDPLFVHSGDSLEKGTERGRKVIDIHGPEF